MFPLFRDDNNDFAGGADGGIGGGGNGGLDGEDNTGGGGGGGGRNLGGSGIVMVQYAYTQPQPVVTSGSVTITGPAEVPDCGESSTFTAVTSGIARPSYQWRKNFVDVPGATASTYTTVADSDDVIQCIVTPLDEEPCDGLQVASIGSNLIRPEYGTRVTISNDLPFSDTNDICEGTLIPFSAHVVRGGTSPHYQWRQNGSNITGATGPTFSSSSLSVNDVIECSVTVTDGACAGGSVQSNELTMRFVDTSYTISTQAHDATYCPNASYDVNYTWDRHGRSCVTDSVPHVFTAQLSDASGSFAIPVPIGSVTGTGAGPGQINFTFPNVPPGSGYRVRVVGPGVVGSDNGTDLTVESALFPPIRVDAEVSTGVACAGDTVSFSAYVPAYSESASYQWLRNGIPILDEAGSQNWTFDTTVAVGDVFACEVTSSLSRCGGTVARSTANTTVYPKVRSAVHISGRNPAGPVCKGTPVTFTTTSDNPGTNPGYEWTVGGATIVATDSFTTTLPIGTSRVSVKMYSNEKCAIEGGKSSDLIDIDVAADITKPTISGMPGDFTVHKKEAGAVSWVEPTSSDNCRVVSFTSDHHSGDVFPVGTTTVTYTATDFENNVQTRSFAVTVDSSPLCGDAETWGTEVCDDGNTLNGDCCSSDCQLESAGTACRALAGVCDVAEACTGTSATCPADAKSTAACRPAAGVCDTGETCDGSSNSCPGDVLVPASTTCRTTSGVCDVAENCTGISADCPANVVQPPGQSCGDASVNQCSGRDICDGTVACNPNDSVAGTACDDGDLCTVNDSCVAGACIGEPLDCDDSSACTQDSCDPLTGTCSSVVEPLAGCRTASGSGLQFRAANGGSGGWKWRHGDATACDEVGSPDIDTDYDVCVYDGTGANTYALATSFHLSANASWALQGDCGWLYADDAAASDGISRFEISTGDDGTASVGFGLRGGNIPFPTPVASNRLFHMNPAVTVQMSNGSGVCWESQFTSAYRNTATNFKSRLKFARPR
jgi:cysteine-rich repeat protein